MERLTKRQKETLDFIRSFLAEHGYAPSYREIAAHFKLSSVATVAQHVSTLNKKGFLEKAKNEARSILPSEIGGSPGIKLPFLGMVAAGQPIAAEYQANEVFEVPETLIRKGRNTYVLQVRVDNYSMVDAGIVPGDFLIIEERHEAKDGETVIAQIGEDHAPTVKKFYRAGRKVRLVSENPTMQDMIVDLERTPFEVVGIVRGVIRKFEG